MHLLDVCQLPLALKPDLDPVALPAERHLDFEAGFELLVPRNRPRADDLLISQLQPRLLVAVQLRPAPQRLLRLV